MAQSPHTDDAAGAVSRAPADEASSVLGHLVGLLVERIAAPVEGMHRSIADRSFDSIGPPAAPVKAVHDAVVHTAYRAVRLTGWGVAAAIGWAAGRAGDSGSPSPRGVRLQATLNALWGDQIETQGSDLAITMGAREPGGNPVDTSDPDRSFPDATSRLVVLVHGLAETEECFATKAAGAGTAIGLRDRIAAEPGLTPVLVRYNSGRRISDSGRELADLIEALHRTWPTTVEEIALVGNSMGGLVARSACIAAREAGHDWVATVRHVVTLGAPHLGAPLEKGINVLGWALGVARETRPLAEFLNGRSAGIKDLRFGAVTETDWQGVDPDALLRDTVSDGPSLDGIDHHFAAAVITADPDHPVGFLVGDLMVRTGSGTGRGRRRRVTAADVRVLGGRRHSDLLHDPEVGRQVVSWLGAPPAIDREKVRPATA